MKRIFVVKYKIGFIYWDWWFSNVVWNLWGFLTILWRDPHAPNYFHNNTEMLFGFLLSLSSEWVVEFLEATWCMVFNKEKAEASMNTQLSSIKLDIRHCGNSQKCKTMPLFLLIFSGLGKYYFYKIYLLCKNISWVLNKISYVHVFKLPNLISEILNTNKYNSYK